MRKLVCILLLLLTVLVLNGQTKHALVVGIGKYPVMSGWRKINGDRDADSVVKILAQTGFKDVICLKNEKATKNNILLAFKELTDRCKMGDVVYIHFSGHGQQVEDVNGDETDGKDESWIPYDACVNLCPADSGEKHLIDDEIGILLDKIYRKVGEDGKILVVADACHSGSSTRVAEEDDVVVRGTSSVFKATIGSEKANVQTNWILVSACGDKQSNYELKNPAMGKLTYAITWLIKNGCKDDNKTIKQRIQQFYDDNRTVGEQTLYVSGVIARFEISQLFR